MSIAQSIIEVVDEQLRNLPPRKVVSVKVKIGGLTAVEPGSLSFCFDVISKGTILDGAQLDIEEVPIQGHCADCNQDFIVEKFFFACPVCHNANVKLISGEELLVDSIEVE
jgi:hydrogenase nickel incorporation protein HypA/HybF